MDNVQDISQYNAFNRKGDPFFLWIENTSAQNQAITLFDYNASAASNSSTVNTVTDTVTVGDEPAGIAYDSANNRMYVANQNGDNVSVIDCSTNTVIATITVGNAPWGIAYDSVNGRMYVANQSDSTVSVIVCATNTVLTTIGVGANPFAVAYDSANARMYVTNAAGASVSVIVCSTNLVLTTIAGIVNPTGIAYDSANGRMYVSKFSTNAVDVIVCSTNTVLTTISVGTGPRGLAYNSADGTMYVANFTASSISIINCTSNTVTGTILSVLSPFGIAYDSTNNTMFTGNSGAAVVYIIDCVTNTITDTITVGTVPIAIAYNISNSTMGIANFSTDNVSIIQTASAIQFTTAPGTTYSALCANLIGNNAWIKRFDIQAESSNQLNQAFSVSLTDQMTGNALVWALIPRVPPNQRIPALNDVETKYPIVLDGFTTLSTTIVAGERVLYLFWFLELGSMTLAEKHILKENIEAVKEQIIEQNEFRAEKWLCKDVKDVYLYYNDEGHLPCNNKKQAA